MLKKKNLLSLILAFCLCYALAAPAWAADDEMGIYNDNYQTAISVIPIALNEAVLVGETETDTNAQIATFVVPISSPDNVCSVPIGYIKNESNERAADATLIWATLVRRNVLHDCELFLNWTGTDVYQSWKFSKCIVDNAQFINPVIYGRFLSWKQDVVASWNGNVRIGAFAIPDDVTEARVAFSSLYGYDLNKAMWRSVNMVPKLGEIQ